MSTFDSLDKTFNVDATIDAGAKAMKSITKRVKKEYASESDEDYDYVRGLLKSSAEALCRITANAEDMAEETAHPRAAEVAANAAKQTAEVAEKIMALHKDKKELDSEVTQAQVSEVRTQNNIFMSGSTSDLLKALKSSDALSGVDVDAL